METLVNAFGPIVVGAFVIQRLIELLEPFIQTTFNLRTDSAEDQQRRRFIFGVISVVAALFMTFAIDIRVLNQFGIENKDFWDGICTAIIISAGTEGSNSFLKILEYYKTHLKTDAQNPQPPEIHLS